MKVNILKVYQSSRLKPYVGTLTLRFRDEYDLAEPEEVRGAVLDDAVVFMLGFDELVGWTKSPAGCRRCDERCVPGGASILRFSDRLASATTW
jgi:hypothetical protein